MIFEVENSPLHTHTHHSYATLTYGTSDHSSFVISVHLYYIGNEHIGARLSSTCRFPD